METSKTIALVACVSKKQDTPQKAKDLYISDWFRKASTYAAANAEQWFILSAKYGLIAENEFINPYELQLKTKSDIERIALRSQYILKQLIPIYNPRTSCMLYKPGFLPFTHSAARRAPLTNVSRVWAE